MSDPLRIAFVVENPTNSITLQEIVTRLLEGSDFVWQAIQPEMSEALEHKTGQIKGSYG